MTMTKQTAANNEILALTKKAMNAKVYKAASEVMNLDGEEAALAYLQGFFCRPVRESLASLAGHVDAIRAGK